MKRIFLNHKSKSLCLKFFNANEILITSHYNSIKKKKELSLNIAARKNPIIYFFKLKLKSQRA